MPAGNDQLKETLSQHLRILKDILQIREKLVRLLGSSELDFQKAKRSIAELEKHLQSLREKEPTLIDGLQRFIDEANSQVDRLFSQKRNRFGSELEKRLTEIGIKLEGHYPELRAGLFTIELDFDSNKAIIWYGPKQERMGLCPLSPDKIVKMIAEIRSSLGSGLEKEALLGKLREAYFRASKGKDDIPVPILEVMRELAFLLQPPAFFVDPRKENYKSYSRADFSYDLFRLSNVRNLKLVTATRAFTKSRSKFLWVPHSESGAGTTYSHLRYKGNLEFNRGG